MLRRVAASFVASLLFWLAALAAPSSPTSHAQYGRELELASAFGARTICVERATITLRVSTLERRAAHARWAPDAESCAARIAPAQLRVHDVLVARARAHVPHALRRTYDAHAPPATSLA
jgi:hypothetical protein